MGIALNLTAPSWHHPFNFPPWLSKGRKQTRTLRWDRGRPQGRCLSIKLSSQSQSVQSSPVGQPSPNAIQCPCLSALLLTSLVSRPVASAIKALGQWGVFRPCLLIMCEPCERDPGSLSLRIVQRWRPLLDQFLLLGPLSVQVGDALLWYSKSPGHVEAAVVAQTRLTSLADDRLANSPPLGLCKEGKVA